MKQTLFDRPLHRDLLFWWAVALAVMAYSATAAYYPDGVYNDFTAIAFTIDLAARVLFNVGLFALLPAAARRRRRRKRLEVQTADEVR